MLEMRSQPPQAASWFGLLAALVRAVRPFAVTCLVFLAALVIQLSPEWGEALQYDRASLAAGQWWRALTCHLVHWNHDHFLWDAVMFVALGGACERRSRGQLVQCLLLAAIVISSLLYLWMPDLATYRGLSGLDTALFTLWLGAMIRYLCLLRAWNAAALLGLGMLGLAGKLGYELVTGHTLFVDSSAAGFTPVVLAHALGALLGAGYAFRPVLMRRSRFPLF